MDNNQLKDLSIVYCKDCRSFDEKIFKDGAKMWSCTKESNRFEVEEPALYRHRKCFRFKKEKLNDSKK